MGELNNAMAALMDSIRAKSGVTGKLGVVAAKQAVDSIQTGGDAADLPYRRYTGTITETVVGSGKYAVLAKSSDLAEHRNDESLMVIVKFEIEPTAYTIVSIIAVNSTELWGIESALTGYQKTKRWDGSAARGVGSVAVPINTDSPAGVGCVQITEDGELRCYSNSTSNYAIRPCNYTVEVMWG